MWTSPVFVLNPLRFLSLLHSPGKNKNFFSLWIDNISNKSYFVSCTLLITWLNIDLRVVASMKLCIDFSCNSSHLSALCFSSTPNSWELFGFDFILFCFMMLSSKKIKFQLKRNKMLDCFDRNCLVQFQRWKVWSTFSVAKASMKLNSKLVIAHYAVVRILRTQEAYEFHKEKFLRYVWPENTTVLQMVFGMGQLNISERKKWNAHN